MGRLPTWVRGLLAVFVLAGGAALIWWFPIGQSDEDSGRFTEGRQPMPSSSQVPVTPPLMPSESQQNTPEGAKAFVRYFFSVMQYADMTGRVAEYKSLYEPDCERCLIILSVINEIYEKGNRQLGGEYSILDMQTGPLPTGSLVIVQYKRTKASIVNKEGNTIEGPSGAVEKAEVAIELRWIGNSWHVVRMNKVKQ